jgi:cytochrome c556
MKRVVVVAGIGFILAAGAVAQSDVIAQRKDLMKANGAAARLGTQMARAEAPFDLAKAREIFTGIAERLERFPELFPENSRAGGDTHAAPRIWEDMAGFRMAAAKIVQDAGGAARATTDLASFQSNFQRVGGDCNACHQTYRINPP